MRPSYHNKRVASQSYWFSCWFKVLALLTADGFGVMVFRASGSSLEFLIPSVYQISPHGPDLQIEQQRLEAHLAWIKELDHQI